MNILKEGTKEWVFTKVGVSRKRHAQLEKEYNGAREEGLDEEQALQYMIETMTNEEIDALNDGG